MLLIMCPCGSTDVVRGSYFHCNHCNRDFELYQSNLLQIDRQEKYLPDCIYSEITEILETLPITH